MPSGGKISVSYWWDGETNSSSQSCDDTLTASLVDSNGQTIATMQQVCNTDASGNWKQESFDVTNKLSNYAGQTVTLVFEGQTGGFGGTTAFFVDDVAVNAG